MTHGRKKGILFNWKNKKKEKGREIVRKLSRKHDFI
jgi:hypothetical protein